MANFRAFLICLTMLSLVFASCSKEQADPEAQMVEVTELNPMDDFEWMLGKWMKYQDSIVTYEIWDRESDHAFVGRGITLKSSDTVFVEYLRLENTDSGLFYIAQVPHNPDLVQFRMTSHQAETTVFENPEHDFPTRIIYTSIGTDSMHARIEGERGGEPAGVDFIFERVR